MSPFKTILLFALLAAIGIVFIPQLPVDLQPDTRSPQLTVSYSLPDAPPQVVEQEATAPLENAFAQISQIKSLYSVSNYEQGTIELTFDRDVDMAFKKFEVSSVIRQLYPKLHAQVSYRFSEATRWSCFLIQVSRSKSILELCEMTLDQHSLIFTLFWFKHIKRKEVLIKICI